MRRREFIGLMGTASLSFAQRAHAQTKTDVPVVALFLPLKPDTPIATNRIAAVRKGLEEEGFVEPTNYSLATRYSEGDVTRVPPLLTQVSGLAPRVFVIVGSGVDLARRAFPETPLVFTGIAADPIALGWVKTYAHPGGMLTGNVMNAVGGEETMVQKRIGLFKQLVPDLTRLCMIASNAAITALKEKDALQKVAAELGFEVVHQGLKTPDDLEAAFAAGIRENVGAFYISGEPLLVGNMDRVLSLVASSRKPSVGHYPDWGRAGLLMSYATDPLDGLRRAGAYAAKILKGAYPNNLPIEQASKFTLVINQKTAKALGIVVPPNLLALADEVIE